MEAILLIGIQGAGKSTFYARRFVDTHLRLNRDMLRTNHRLDVLFHAALALQQPLCLDNTQVRRGGRARLIAGARAAGFRVLGYWFDVPLEEALARNRLRAESARIPEVGIRGLAAKFEPPAADEGFHEIHRVRVVPPDFEVEPLHVEAALGDPRS
ncbi:MAG: AAA family ATPase [Nannocystaceae bacterium]